MIFVFSLTRNYNFDCIADEAATIISTTARLDESTREQQVEIDFCFRQGYPTTVRLAQTTIIYLSKSLKKGSNSKLTFEFSESTVVSLKQNP